MTAAEIKRLFEVNEDFQEYVKRYIRKNGKTIEQALRDAMVREYASYLVEKRHIAI